MRELRWLLRVAPPFAALAAVVALGSAPLRSTAMAAGCGGQSLAAATRVAPPAPRAVAGAAAFVIAPLLDASGTLAGQRVEVGTVGRVSAQLELPAESFAAGPFGRAVLVGADDGRSSTLRALDATSGCSWSPPVSVGGRLASNWRWPLASRSEMAASCVAPFVTGSRKS